MVSLAGLGVLVTRPESQAGPLARHLASLGATVYQLPALSIVPRSDVAAQCTKLGPLADFDWAIFISANAVRYGAGRLPTASAPRVAAVGPATAAALTHAGYRLSLVPARGFDSEHVLACPELQSMQGQRVLLIRGGVGRDLLAETLTARGAHVETLDVYERVRATPPPGAVDAVERAWARGHIQVVTATSTEIARALFELLSPEGRALYARTAILVGSARIADSVRRLGLNGPLVIAASPHDDGLIAALLATPRERLQPNASA
jgi:uroporphyrinogen-III synthase